MHVHHFISLTGEKKQVRHNYSHEPIVLRGAHAFRHVGTHKFRIQTNKRCPPSRHLGLYIAQPISRRKFPPVAAESDDEFQGL